MANKLLKAAAALLLAGVTVGSFAACTFETPEWAEQALCDHVFDEKEILEAPTCGSSGTALKICTECGKTKHVTLSATGKHEFSEWEETTPPTSETPGEKTRTCNVCGKTEKEELPVQDIPEVQVHPDENHDGICDDCGEDIFANATYSALQVGDAISGGWYRVSSAPFGGEGIGQISIKLSYSTFDYDSEKGMSVKDVGEKVITLTSEGMQWITDVTLCKTLKKDGQEIMVSGFSRTDAQMKYVSEGAFIYISNPYELYDMDFEKGDNAYYFGGLRLLESSHTLEKAHH